MIKQNMFTKKEIRQRQIQLLKQLAPNDKKQQAKVILQNLKNSSLYQKAQAVALFWSTAIELPTHQFIATAAEEKQIYLPVISPKHQLQFRKYQPQQMHFVKGIGEPLPTCPMIALNDLDLLIVPGLIFSQEGHFRIGFGGGYYDRLLTNYQGATAAIILNQQIRSYPNWKVSRFDQPIRYFFTTKLPTQSVESQNG